MTVEPTSTAVLTMAYGTPARPEDVEEYYTHVRHGRPPTSEQLADLRRRYEAIGGVSPLSERTRSQCQGLQHVLDEMSPDEYVVYFGAKHSLPYIEDTAAEIAATGHQKVVGLVLAPHYSSMSVGEYLERARTALDRAPADIEFRGVEAWYDHPTFVDILASRWRQARSRFAEGERVLTLVTAHSLPERILDSGDPYPKQLQATAEQLAVATGMTDWEVGWQSAGRTPEPWIGPDILEIISQLPERGFDGVLICPAGFISDHLEVLFDIDIEAKQLAQKVGVHLERTESLNDDGRLLETLADVVRTAT